jgi:hypothetical protein
MERVFCFFVFTFLHSFTTSLTMEGAARVTFGFLFHNLKADFAPNDKGA